MKSKEIELKEEIEKLSKVKSNALNFEEVIREQKYLMGELKGRTEGYHSAIQKALEIIEEIKKREWSNFYIETLLDEIIQKLNQEKEK